jgi:hypothetical protein
MALYLRRLYYDFAFDAFMEATWFDLAKVVQGGTGSVMPSVARL